MNQKQASTNDQLGRFKNQDAVKLRGGYYTSAEVAGWLCQWAIRHPDDHILEPSCGDGAFLLAALARFVTLGVSSPAIAARNLRGVELVQDEAEIARKRLHEQYGPRVVEIVETGDFFDSWKRLDGRTYDAVIGNPPFIRYQTFPEPYRTRAMDIMVELGLKPNRLTNIWVPFVVAAAGTLRPGGRLALVLPAELLQVSYAAQLRSYLTDRFSRIDIIACNELFFEKAEQEVILLLADGALSVPSRENNCRVTMTQARAVSEITAQPPGSVIANTKPKAVRHDSEKWLKYFLTNDEIALMRQLREEREIATLSAHGSVDVGVVTGRNSFFVLGGRDRTKFKLEEYTVPIISRSEQLRGAHLSLDDWQNLADAGNRVHLLHLSPFQGKPLGESIRRYIQLGEDQGVHQGYKCSIRSPWYAVPSVWQPQGFLLRQIYDFPRIIVNDVNATSTDTIHRLRCKYQPRQVAANSYTYLTAASAEIEGRSYGGGVLELEPTEAERLLMPRQLSWSISIDECDRLVRAGNLEELLAENSERILINGVGLARRDCLMLRNIWKKMRDRRNARRRRRRRTAGERT